MTANMQNAEKTFNKPKVSVIIPTHNEEKHIGECLNCMLNQTYKNLEIIVADYSKDKTREIVKKYASKGVHLVERSRPELALGRNEGARVATGDILVFVDADMMLDENFVEELTRPLREGEVIGTSWGFERLANEDNLIARCWGPYVAGPGAVTYRAIPKDVFMSVGGFSPELRALDDHSLHFKLKVNPKVVFTATYRHYRPETFKETFAHAKWIGDAYSNVRKLGLLKFPLLTVLLRQILIRASRFSFPLAMLWPQYLFIYLPVVLLPPLWRLYKTKHFRFFLTYLPFQFVESAGWLVGFIGGFLHAIRSRDQ